MSFYATQDYEGRLGDNPSLVIAWCHLLQNFGQAVTPDELSDYLSDFTDEPNWDTITAYDPAVKLATAGGSEWPTSKNSIVTFRILGHDGSPTNHSCLIFDPAAKTIIDSTDAQIKNAGVYGNPATFGSYVYSPEVAELVPETIPAAEPSSDRLYVVLKGERIYDISRKLKIPAADLIEHNQIDDPYNLPVGLKLHLPVPVEFQKAQPTYQVYDEPQLMHISRAGGAQKWFFGNVTTVEDIISGSGMYPENKEVYIAGVATVPVGAETFAYYMDGLAMGDYRKTGLVKYTIGFSWADLTVGNAPAQPVQEVPANIAEQIQATIAAIEAPEPEQPAPKPTLETLPNPNKWKSTYLPFQAPTTYIVDLPDGEEEIIVYDQDGRKPQKRLRDTGHYIMVGTFWKDGVEYLRPLQSVQGERDQHNWYGIPRDSMKTEAEMYNTQLDYPSKVGLHHSSLTATERYLIPRFALTQLSYDRLKLYGKKISQKTKEIIK